MPFSALRCLVFMAWGLEEGVAFFLRDKTADLADSLPEPVAGSDSGFSDQRLEFGRYGGMTRHWFKWHGPCGRPARR
jgi:hypothetical protein